MLSPSCPCRPSWAMAGGPCRIGPRLCRGFPGERRPSPSIIPRPLELCTHKNDSHKEHLVGVLQLNVSGKERYPGIKRTSGSPVLIFDRCCWLFAITLPVSSSWSKPALAPISTSLAPTIGEAQAVYESSSSPRETTILSKESRLCVCNSDHALFHELPYISASLKFIPPYL